MLCVKVIIGPMGVKLKDLLQRFEFTAQIIDLQTKTPLEAFLNWLLIVVISVRITRDIVR